MANKRITDRGLLIYYTSYDEVNKIDSTQLGELIKKELAWMSGKSSEPEFEDVRCDIFHMHLKEQIEVRDMARENHNHPEQDKDSPKPIEIEAQPKTKKEVLTQKQKEDLIKWYGILSTEDNDKYFNSSWNQFFDDYETAKIAANDYLRNNLRKYKGWLM